jgi:DNA-binding MarR family transcriptional regulator
MHASCTCLSLRKAARRVSVIYDQHLDASGVTVTQYSILGYIRTHDGIGVGDLAGKLVMDPTTLSRNLQPLVKRGLIVIAACPNDRRSRNLHLSDKGRETLARACIGWDAAQKQIAAVLGKDGPVLDEVIDRMLRRLDD